MPDTTKKALRYEYHRFPSVACWQEYLQLKTFYEGEKS